MTFEKWSEDHYLGDPNDQSMWTNFDVEQERMRAWHARDAAITKLVEALQAWEHWYSEDSTEYNRDTAREMGLAALAEFEGERWQLKNSMTL